jgi:hypothetical protein
MKPTFATVATISLCAMLPVAMFGYRIGEGIGKGEGAESERIKWQEKERLREKQERTRGWVNGCHQG